MENVILIVHLILALCLIGIVLLQRSEGGGLGMSAGGAMTGRAAATALGKLTWAFAIGFIITSITLTILAAANTEGASVIDRITDVPAPIELPDASETESGTEFPLAPAPLDNAPVVPQAAE